MKVVIHVEGGNVQSVYTSHSMEVEIIDFDNLEEEGLNRKQRDRELEVATFGLHEIGGQNK